ncbi:MAG: substrate-binding domain-containing protein [Solirubrobacterales bacterium]|jgi:phosphate transport system substrate-binding protein|nr:substrate-binding domain-containing protein [Solirubrobacterales bacterium]
MTTPRLTGAFAGLAASAMLLPAAASAKPVSVPQAQAAQKPVITLSGSTSVAPLASKLIKGYLKQYKGRAKFKLLQGGSDVGIADVAADRVSIGMSSRDGKGGDPGGIVFNKIARDAICLSTNANNKVANLSQQQVQAIFSGQVRDWGQVPGATTTGPINLVVRTAASGTQDAFQKLFMGSAKIASSAATKASNGLVASSVKSDPNAIGYLSYAFTKGLNDVGYQGTECSLRTAKAGTYPGSRNFWMVTRGKPGVGSPVQKFIYWIQNSNRAAKITASEWVPLK